MRPDREQDGDGKGHRGTGSCTLSTCLQPQVPCADPEASPQPPTRRTQKADPPMRPHPTSYVDMEECNQASCSTGVTEDRHREVRGASETAVPGKEGHPCEVRCDVEGKEGGGPGGASTQQAGTSKAAGMQWMVEVADEGALVLKSVTPDPAGVQGGVTATRMHPVLLTFEDPALEKAFAVHRALKDRHVSPSAFLHDARRPSQCIVPWKINM